MEYNDLVRSLRQCGRWQGQVRSAGRETQCKGCAYHDAENDVCKSWDWKTHEEHIMLDAAYAIEKLQAHAHNSHRSFAFAIAELFLRILGELGYEITIPYDKDYTDGTQTIKMRWKEETKPHD